MYESYGLFIDGRWRQAADAATLPVVDPATEEEVGVIPVATPADLDDALLAAESGFRAWRSVSVNERAACLRRVAEGIRERVDEIARMVTLEMGKPLAESRAEVLASADQFEWNGEEAKRIYGQTLDGREAGVRFSVRFEPVGVVAAFTPWNFPVLLPARKLAPALAAGCSVVIKPAEEAPGASFALAQIASEAGLPAGTLNVVTGEPAKISTHLIASPIVRKVTFTGSVSVGKQLMKLAAEGMKKISFELGGHSPVIIFDDADPERAATACARAKFRNAGQVCVSPSRFYVHRSLTEPFSKAFAAIASALKVGNGMEPGVEMGPLANRRRLEAAGAFVEDARAGGAEAPRRRGTARRNPQGVLLLADGALGRGSRRANALRGALRPRRAASRLRRLRRGHRAGQRPSLRPGGVPVHESPANRGTGYRCAGIGNGGNQRFRPGCLGGAVRRREGERNRARGGNLRHPRVPRGEDREDGDLRCPARAVSPAG